MHTYIRVLYYLYTTNLRNTFKNKLIYGENVFCYTTTQPKFFVVPNSDLNIQLLQLFPHNIRVYKQQFVIR
jgi:hypothetical protein